jgi:hypothetical protein
MKLAANFDYAENIEKKIIADSISVKNFQLI